MPVPPEVRLARHEIDVDDDGHHASAVSEEDVRDAGRWEVLVSGSAPPVAVSTPSDDDWVYGWVSG
jgi:hypothetical protein